MGRLLILFIVVPVVELALLIEIGQRVGTLATIGLIIGTGFVGASLARQQGISTLARLRKDLDASRLPAEAIIDGVMILVAAAVLITPGVLTDLFGFLCLVPGLPPAAEALREAAVRARGAGGNRSCHRGGRWCGRPGTAPADEERNATPPRRSVNTTLTTAGTRKHGGLAPAQPRLLAQRHVTRPDARAVN